MGDGRNKEALRHAIEEAAVQDYFHFIPQQPASAIPQILAAANVAFISFSDNPLFSMTIPAKLQSYMACGMPIIAAADGETRRIIEEASCGICVSPADAPALYNAIAALFTIDRSTLAQMGDNARLYVMKHFNREQLLEWLDSKVADLLDKVC